MSRLVLEVGKIEEVGSFIQLLCESFQIDKLPADFGPMHICLNIIEPFCRSFEWLAFNHIVPSSIKHLFSAMLMSGVDGCVRVGEAMVQLFMPVIHNCIMRNHVIAAICKKSRGIQDSADQIKELFEQCFSR